MSGAWWANDPVAPQKQDGGGDWWKADPVVQGPSAQEQAMARDVLSTPTPEYRAPIVRQAGQGMFEGVAGTPGLPVDLLFGVGNFARRQFGLPETPLASSPLRDWGSEGWIRAAENATGATDNGAPQTTAQRLARKGGTFIGASAPFGMRALALAPEAFAGSEVGRVTDRAGLTGGYGEPGGALVGGSVRNIPTAAGQALRGALRGGDANAAEMRNTLSAFDRIGQTSGEPVSVMPGQLAADHNQMQVVDALLARSPGGQPGIMNANASQQVAAARAVENVAQQPATGMQRQRLPNPTTAGDALQQGFQDFTDRFHQRARQAEQNFEHRIGTQTRTPVTNTQRALTDLQTKAQSDPEIQRLIQDPYVRQVTDAVTNAASGLVNAGGVSITRGGPPTLSFGALRALRSDVGELLGKADLSPNIRGGQLKHLYGALTEDLTDAANQAGVGHDWRRYNQWYSSGMGRIQQTLNRSVKGREQAPETTFNSVMNMNRRQAFQATRSISPQQRAVVAGQALREMGQTTAAGAVSEGADYSYSQFVKNLTDMRQRGTFDAFFGSPELRPLRNLINDLETTSESALRANKVAHDVSGATTVRGTALLSIGGALASGNVPAAVAIFAAAWPGPALLGRAMRSRPFLRWLSNTKSVRPTNWPGEMARLNSIVESERDPETKKALQSYRDALPKAQQVIEREQQQQAQANTQQRRN